MADLNDPRVPGDKDGTDAATGVGAVLGGVAGGVAGGAAAGAAVGGMTGPVGAVVGAAVGAVAGALAGRAVKAGPVAEDAYWRENYAGRDYVAPGTSYDDYSPAYRYGVEAYSRNPDRKFDDVEADLGRDWGTARDGRRWSGIAQSMRRVMPGNVLATASKEPSLAIRIATVASAR